MGTEGSAAFILIVSIQQNTYQASAEERLWPAVLKTARYALTPKSHCCSWREKTLLPRATADVRGTSRKKRPLPLIL